LDCLHLMVIYNMFYVNTQRLMYNSTSCINTLNESESLILNTKYNSKLKRVDQSRRYGLPDFVTKK